MPRTTDFVMFWWRRAADLVRAGKAQRFGLITTNSLPQVFNRQVVAAQLDAKKPLSIVFAIPDHPWYLNGEMAAVRIAMTVCVAGKREGQLNRVLDAHRNAAQGGDELRPPVRGLILANLTSGVDLDAAKPLRANERVSKQGVKLVGAGFLVTPERAQALGLGTIPGLERHVRRYRNGRDITARPRDLMVIDLFGLTEREVMHCYPAVCQHVLQSVKPERDQNRRESRKANCWIFGEPISTFRPALAGLLRYCYYRGGKASDVCVR